MRILVFEYVTGGGLLGHNLPRSLAREGAAMLSALVRDLASVGVHQIVTTRDPRVPFKTDSAVDVVTMTSRRQLDRLMASADAIWLIAPEMDRCLERLAERAETLGKTLLGSGAAVIRRASDKAMLGRHLAAANVAYPTTIALLRRNHEQGARRLGYPLVVKPRRGAGCNGVSLVHDERELKRAVALASASGGGTQLLLQQFVPGVAASVSLLADGTRAIPLAVNSQRLSLSQPFVYRGGTTPLEHPLADRAEAIAVRAVESLPGLRGYIGVDVVLTEREAVVIEINPRLTTAYLGIRSVIRENVAALAIAACTGALPHRPRVMGGSRFTASGRVTPIASMSVAGALS